MSTFIDVSAHFTANPLRKITSSFKRLCSLSNYDISTPTLDENVDLQPINEALENLMNSLSNYTQNNVVLSSEDAIMDIRLSSIQKRLALHSIQLTSFIPLINSISSNATDIDVWNEVTQLVDTHELIQSAETNMTTGQHVDAYHRRCSAPLEGPDQIMGTLKEALRTELAGSVFENVRGFYKSYFEGPKWANHCEEIAKHYKNRPDKETIKFPKNPTEEHVWQ
ncbi:unnamed protein product [Blumeria hordei]|uniref:Uncharacterized protein n=1 Tax=Blumeria hordei TaxID=2867405 RepID=A0A383V0M4_BLUHO|nr:unnamed protein product [Blumeria hordei]